MRTTDCPNCGNTIADPSAGCSCGFSLFDGVEVPPPAIVRETTQQHAHSEVRAASQAPVTGSRDASPPAPHPPPNNRPGSGRGEREAVWPFDEVLATVDERLTPGPGADVTPQSRLAAGPTPAQRRLATSPRSPQTPPLAPSSSPTSRSTPPATGGRTAAPRPRDGMLMGCPSCGVRISRRAPTCPKCGVAPYTACQICASLILSNSMSCPECGDPSPFQA